MELKEITDLMASPEKLIEPNQIVLLVQHISEFITHYEMEVDDLEMAYGLRWAEVKYAPTKVNPDTAADVVQGVGKPLSDKQTDIRMLSDPLYKNLMVSKRTLKQLSRYRSDLNRKLDIIMGIKRNK